MGEDKSDPHSLVHQPGERHDVVLPMSGDAAEVSQPLLRPRALGVKVRNRGSKIQGAVDGEDGQDVGPLPPISERCVPSLRQDDL